MKWFYTVWDCYVATTRDRHSGLLRTLSWCTPSSARLCKFKLHIQVYIFLCKSLSKSFKTECVLNLVSQGDDDTLWEELDWLIDSSGNDWLIDWLFKLIDFRYQSIQLYSDKLIWQIWPEEMMVLDIRGKSLARMAVNTPGERVTAFALRHPDMYKYPGEYFTLLLLIQMQTEVAIANFKVMHYTLMFLFVQHLTLQFVRWVYLVHCACGFSGSCIKYISNFKPRQPLQHTSSQIPLYMIGIARCWILKYITASENRTHLLVCEIVTGTEDWLLLWKVFSIHSFIFKPDLIMLD